MKRWGICNPRQTACHSWYSRGALTQAEEIRCQFKAGHAANLQVSHNKRQGHLKTLRIFFLPVFFSYSLNHPMFGNTSIPPLCFCIHNTEHLHSEATLRWVLYDSAI